MPHPLSAIGPGLSLRPAVAADAAEVHVLQRCCWVAEAIANDTMDIPALHESVEDVRRWLTDRPTWLVHRDGRRLVAAVRAHVEGPTWAIGRLMVAPDLAGRGLERWLLAHAERQAPDGVRDFVLFTGARSARNLRTYAAAGYQRCPTPSPSGRAHPRRGVPAEGSLAACERR